MTGYGGAVRRQSSRRRLQVGGTILTVDLESGPNPNFIEVGVQISGVAVNAIGARIHQLILAESSGEQAHPQCASALGCKQSQILSPTTTQFSRSVPSFRAAARNKSGSGLARCTSSLVITGMSLPSPNNFNGCSAPSRLPLVAIAQGTPNLESVCSKSLAPGRTWTVSTRFLNASL